MPIFHLFRYLKIAAREKCRAGQFCQLVRWHYAGRRLDSRPGVARPYPP